MNDPSVPTPSGFTPPFSEDLLADLHGGVLDPETSEGLWPLVEDDPVALAYIRKLDNVTHSLRTWDDNSVSETIPPELTARLHTALDNERKQQRIQHDSGSNAVPIRRTRHKWVIAGAAAAAVAVAAVLIAVHPAEPATELTAQPTPTVNENPDPENFLTLIGSKNLGPLNDPDKLAQCLQANGFDDDQQLLGSGEVTVDGNPAVVLLLRGTLPRQITALAVGPDCSADNPNTLSIKNIG